MLIDAHCHLDQVDDPDQAVTAARAAGVERIVAVSQDLESMQAVLRLRDRHPGIVVPALGVHPQLIPTLEDPALEEACRFMHAHLDQAAAVGEVGLDYKYARTEEERARQGRWFERQLELAAEHRKPVNLHSRRALRPVMERAIVYQETTGCAAQLHWFTHSTKLIKLTNAAGVYVSAGPVTLLSPDARAVAAAVDPDLLLIETDCPVPFDGESARPDWVPRVLRNLAAARDVDPGELERRIAANFERLMATGAS